MQSIKVGSIVTATYKGNPSLKWVNAEVVAIEENGDPVIKGKYHFVTLKRCHHIIELIKE